MSVADSAAIQNATKEYDSAMAMLNSGEELSEQQILQLQEKMNYYKLLMETLTSMVQAEGQAKLSGPKKM